jgi:hypothetical protein
MEQIYDTHDKIRSFDFTKLTLSKPTLISGGNYFIRFKKDNYPLYVQPPRCYTRNGFIKNGRKYYTDLLFNNDDEYFIQWLEKLEEHCVQYIYDNRNNWFDGDMEKPDIENYFTSPLKIYKSGKFYLVRTNIPTSLENPSIKIYDESENIVDFTSITETTHLMSILEIQGIKCSARSFQIEIEMKQALVLTPQELPIFDKCVIQSSRTSQIISESTSNHDDNVIDNDMNITTSCEQTEDIINNIEKSQIDTYVTPEEEDSTNDLGQIIQTNIHSEIIQNVSPYTQVVDVTNTMDKNDTLKVNAPIHENKTNMEEFELTLEELSNEDKVTLKEPTDIYYKMYRDARQKAKLARELALSSYLEAKNIKNTYMLKNIEDSDNSDLEYDTESLNSENENTQ